MLPPDLQELATRWMAFLPGRDLRPLDYATLPGRTIELSAFSVLHLSSLIEQEVSGGRSLSSMIFGAGVIHSQSPAAFVEHGGRWLWVTTSSCLFHLFELPPLVIISQLSRAVKDGQ